MSKMRKIDDVTHLEESAWVATGQSTVVNREIVSMLFFFFNSMASLMHFTVMME